MRWIPLLAIFLYVYIEISIFIQVAHVMGVLMTLILVIFTSVIGMSLVRNQGFKNFVPKAENISTYLYYYLNIHIRQIEQLGTGTTFKEVSREDVLKFPILKPSDTILDLWEERVSALNNKQFEIQKEKEYLTKQRDGLLPLLMNGQVSVNSDLSLG